MYYLQSRYYDPAIGRFVNADGYASTGQGIIGFNMFAYCNNNPVNGCDPSGNLNWDKLISGVSLIGIGLTACAVAAAVVVGGACAPLTILAGITFAAGGITTLNGVAEVVESVTGYNYMRDSVYNGNEQAYETQKNVAATVAEVGTVALSVASGTSALCFVAGTSILVAEGCKNIEDISVGDSVWAWNEETGKRELKEVTETYLNYTNTLVHILVNGEEIITTPSHPFFIINEGWCEADSINTGDALLLANGEYVYVTDVFYEVTCKPVAVYNFNVSDYHTYYVSELGILVHNACTNPGGRKGGAAHQGKIAEIGQDLVNRGYEVTYEFRVNTPGGTKTRRYLDIFADNGYDSFGIQVGRSTTSGLPVSRERKALFDIISNGVKAIFIAYD